MKEARKIAAGQFKRKRRRKAKRKSFHPVARAVRKVKREAEAEMSKILSRFLGVQTVVKFKTTRPDAKEEGDTVSMRTLMRRAEAAAMAWGDMPSDGVEDIGE